MLPQFLKAGSYSHISSDYLSVQSPDQQCRTEGCSVVFLLNYRLLPGRLGLAFLFLIAKTIFPLYACLGDPKE